MESLINSKPEATTSPPKPPRRLNPRAMKKVDTHTDDSHGKSQTPNPKSQIPTDVALGGLGFRRVLGFGVWDLKRALLRSYIPSAGADGEAAVVQLDADGVPAPVLLSGARVPQV